ncbi:MAG: hypothetical protein GX409_09650 [candidate division Zixibacteria bacterium]|nr:hypothetical protein [candidate division Zixibacteria bacterium]
MKIRFGIALFTLIISAAAFAQVDLLGTACEPYGSVSIHNEPAADNLLVVAYINGVEFARCLTLGGQYQLYIPKDNQDTPEKDGWNYGDIIIIKINGNQANPSVAASPGRSRVDLSVNTLSVRLDTWGKIKALFR